MTISVAASASAKSADGPQASGPDSLTWNSEGIQREELQISTSWPDLEKLRQSWTSATGAGVRVCVIDSGIDPGHPLVGEVAATYFVRDDDGQLSIVPDDAGDPYGHGTACAGIIRRVAPECELTSVRVLGMGYGSGAVLLTGLRWAVDQGYDVINLSLSTNRLQFAAELHSIIDSANFHNSLIVASAHNSKVESFPWRFSSVVSVGRHTESDDSLVYRNPRPPVDFFGCGTEVKVAWVGGTERRSTGNSFATPQVAGRCALIKSAHPDFTTTQLKCALALSADNLNFGGIR